MISIGNDIVSLEAAHSERFKQKEYYSKILSPSELKFFEERKLDNLSFENFLWIAWTIKEATYKFFKRLHTDLLFNPTNIIVQKINIDNNYSSIKMKNNFLEDKGFLNNNWIDAEVLLDDKIISAKSIITDEFIFSVVCTKQNFENIFWGIKKINQSDYKNQSIEVRNFFSQKIKSICPTSFFQIEKNEHKIPLLKKDNAETETPLSFTHHENFVAYSFVQS